MKDLNENNLKDISGGEIERGEWSISSELSFPTCGFNNGCGEGDIAKIVNTCIENGFDDSDAQNLANEIKSRITSAKNLFFNNIKIKFINDSVHQTFSVTVC